MEYINKSYTYKLKLNSKQLVQINNMIGSCRWLYNLAKETRENAYKSHRISFSCYDLIKQITDLKKEATFLSNVPIHSLQEVIERLDKAYKAYFRKLRNGEIAQGKKLYIAKRKAKCLEVKINKLKNFGKPKWAKRGEYNSVTFKEVKQDGYNRIKLHKLGSVKYFASQEMKGELKRATIIKENNNYYISILTKQAVSELPYFCENQADVGCDMGITYFLVTSNEEYIENPRYLGKSLKKLRIEQRSLDRKVKDSNNWEKQRKVVGNLHFKVKCQRKDFIDKISTRLVLKNKLIAIEGLNVQGMVKNKRLSRYITDVSWGMFFEKLKYKAEWYGSQVVEVNPMHTSQTCPVCGCVSKENRKSQSKFKCISCGYEANADFVGSKNILVRAKTSLRKRKAVA